MANVVLPFDGDFASLRRMLSTWGWEVGERPHTPVFAKGPGVTLNAYATGKMLLNGPRAHEWAAVIQGERPPPASSAAASPARPAPAAPPRPAAPARARAAPPAGRAVPGWLLHFDGACMPQNPGGVAAYGYQVLKDGVLVHEGHGLASPPGPTSTNNVAEFAGLVEGLRWLAAHAKPGEPVRVRGDSRLVVKTVNGLWRVHVLHLKALHAEAVRLLKQLDASLEWVPRERNGDADRLSRVGWDEAVRAHPEWGIR